MNLSNHITCPHCKNQFELTEAISHDLESKYQSQLNIELNKKESEFSRKLKSLEKEKSDLSQKVEEDIQALKNKIENDLKNKIRQQFELENKDLKTQLDEQRSKAQTAQQRELQLLKLQREIETKQGELELDLAKKIEVEKVKIENDLKNKIRGQFELENKDLKTQLDEQKIIAEEAQKKELDLLKKQREIEAQKKQLELDVARKLSEERTKIQIEAKENADSAMNLKLAEKDKQLGDLQKTISELQRKSSVTSQQLQGEVLELQIENTLREIFPEDNITEVKKGARGADIIHEVYFQSGRKAGSIIYECKQTNEWGNQWVGKLKEDMRESNSNVGVIVSIALPKEVKLMGLHEGIWVTHPSMVKSLSMLLRDGLIKAARAELAAATPQDQKDLLFKYMTSPKFSQKIQAMFEATISMKQTILSEKRSITKGWKKREQEVENFELQMINLYGELEGVVGKALPKVELLELPSPVDDE